MTASIRILASAALMFSASHLDAKTVPIPDFTKGDAVPEGFTKDWNLGPTGARGWIYSDQLVTSDARQILITTIDPGSPAEGVLAQRQHGHFGHRHTVAAAATIGNGAPARRPRRGRGE